MYATLVRHRVRKTFEDLDRGQYEGALAGMADRFEHSFAGDHPIGGVRHTHAGMRRWFERLFRLNKSLDFDLKHITVAGMPWDTTITVEWTDGATLANGAPYLNQGVHIIRMKWGKVTSIHAYLDTAVWQAACASMARDGIAEAVADKIED